MTPLWIVISATVCIGSIDDSKYIAQSYSGSDGAYVYRMSPVCFQSAQISTFPVTAKDGETVYRVVPMEGPTLWQGMGDEDFEKLLKDTEADVSRLRTKRQEYYLDKKVEGKPDCSSCDASYCERNGGHDWKPLIETQGSGIEDSFMVLFGGVQPVKPCPICGARMHRREGMCAVLHSPGSRCDWADPFCPNSKNHGIEICKFCKKKRRKVTTEKWEESE